MFVLRHDRSRHWIVAALLAFFYLYAGGRKVAGSRERLPPMMGRVDRMPMPLIGLNIGLLIAAVAAAWLGTTWL
ncbi:hypothetical protein [Actinoplanes sp. NPDC051411]|uniref:hypothetical protein n=1 Tax=Actinoplanes sp. NPDC051411 TaxID=3155522 RepID=UPI0034256F22